MVKFKLIPYESFVILENVIIDMLSIDKYYAYRICLSVITGDLEEDLVLLDVGPLNHSRWLTLVCFMFQLQTTTIVKFIVIVIFNMVSNRKLTDSSRNLFFF